MMNQDLFEWVQVIINLTTLHHWAMFASGLVFFQKKLVSSLLGGRNGLFRKKLEESGRNGRYGRNWRKWLECWLILILLINESSMYITTLSSIALLFGHFFYFVNFYLIWSVMSYQDWSCWMVKCNIYLVAVYTK